MSMYFYTAHVFVKSGSREAYYDLTFENEAEPEIVIADSFIREFNDPTFRGKIISEAFDSNYIWEDEEPHTLMDEINDRDWIDNSNSKRFNIFCEKVQRMNDIEYVVFAVDCDKEYWMDYSTYWYDAKVIDFKQNKIITIEWRGTKTSFESDNYIQDPFNRKVAKNITKELSNGQIYQFDIGDFLLQGKHAGKVSEKDIQGIAPSEKQIASNEEDKMETSKKNDSNFKNTTVQIPTGISAGTGFFVGLKSDGTVVTAAEKEEYDEYDWDKLNVSDWRDITMVSAGSYNIIGLKSDHTVVSTAVIDEDYDCGQTEVNEWRDILMVSAGNYHTVGLKLNGTVVSTTVKIDIGDVDDSLDVDLDLFNEDYGQTQVNDWEDIVMIAAGEYHTVGLKSDGTVVSTTVTKDENDRGQTEVEGWEDIIMISANEGYTVGLKSDGTVVTTTITDEDYDYGQEEVYDWQDIVMISAGETHIVGLKSDGTVVTTPINDEDYDFGQTNVEDWDNIIAVAAGNDFTLGLKTDGSIVITESGDEDHEEMSGIDDWDAIVNPSFK